MLSEINLRAGSHLHRFIGCFLTASVFFTIAGCGASPGVAPIDLETWIIGSSQQPQDVATEDGVLTQTGTAPGFLGLSTLTPTVAGVVVNGGAGGTASDGGEDGGEGGEPPGGEPSRGGSSSGDPGSGGSGQTSTPTQGPRLLPWFEFCSATTAEADEIVELCLGMQRWTDGAIVVTQAGGEWIYDELSRRVPGFQILPGARVVQFEYHRELDDPLRWQAVADFARTVQALTGTKRFVLEVEYPLYGYWEGNKIINMEGLASGLRRLPPELDYIWYPAGLANGHQQFLEQALGRCLALWRTIQSALPHVTFTAAGPANNPFHFNRPWEQVNDQMLRSEGRRTLDSVYIGDSYPGLWPMSSAHQAVALVRTPEAYVWCPQQEWPVLSDILAQPPPTGPGR